MSTPLGEEARAKLDEVRKKEEEDLVVILSQKYGIGHANLHQIEVNAEALRLVPEEDARSAEMVVFRKKGNEVSVALRTPNSDKAQKIIKELKDKGLKVVPYMVSRASLEHAWNHYKDISLAVETSAGVLNISAEEVAKLKDSLDSLDKVRTAIQGSLDMQKQYRVTRILEIVIAGALANGVSDVHFEPREKEALIRFRLDGVLTNMVMLDLETYFSALTRIKLLSGLKINIKSSAQDGRFSLRLDTREIELRTSILPGGEGESIVLRLLDPHSIGVPLEELGMRPELLVKIGEELSKPNGMILNTGPTGSGKTTTLYAFLKKVMNPGIKILTIEDPIEYKLEGVQQSQVNHKDYTFAEGLRSALRQDPDIIMVGEIRDTEVAETAVHAALTGHLVFSTLHTNNAAGAFPRLIDMGIQPSMAGSAVNAVMAQRLLRRIVPEKCHKVTLEGKDREFVDMILDKIHDKSRIPKNTSEVFVPNEGEERPYVGRVAVYETIFTTREIEQAIRSNLTIRELEDEARKQQGFLSMHEDGVLKMFEGITTLQEVRRVLGESSTI